MGFKRSFLKDKRKWASPAAGRAPFPKRSYQTEGLLFHDHLAALETGAWLANVWLFDGTADSRLWRHHCCRHQGVTKGRPVMSSCPVGSNLTVCVVLCCVVRDWWMALLDAGSGEKRYRLCWKEMEKKKRFWKAKTTWKLLDKSVTPNSATVNGSKC